MKNLSSGKLQTNNLVALRCHNPLLFHYLLCYEYFHLYISTLSFKHEKYEVLYVSRYGDVSYEHDDENQELFF